MGDRDIHVAVAVEVGHCDHLRTGAAAASGSDSREAAVAVAGEDTRAVRARNDQVPVGVVVHVCGRDMRGAHRCVDSSTDLRQSPRAVAVVDDDLVRRGRLDGDGHVEVCVRVEVVEGCGDPVAGSEAHREGRPRRVREAHRGRSRCSHGDQTSAAQSRDDEQRDRSSMVPGGSSHPGPRRVTSRDRLSGCTRNQRTKRLHPEPAPAHGVTSMPVTDLSMHRARCAAIPEPGDVSCRHDCWPDRKPGRTRQLELKVSPFDEPRAPSGRTRRACGRCASRGSRRCSGSRRAWWRCPRWTGPRPRGRRPGARPG